VKSRLKARLSFANVVAMLALFVALGGTGIAAGVVPNGSIGTPQLKADAVTSGKVKNGTLKAADFAKGQLKPGPKGATGATGPAGPTGPIGPTGVVDTNLFYSKVQSDARFLQGALVTVIASSGSVAINSFGSATATCPAGYQVISGGLDPENVLTMVMTSFEPIVENANFFGLSDGQHGAPTAWRAWMRNNGGAPATFKVMAVCARIG
jgi:hypothetical protein